MIARCLGLTICFAGATVAVGWWGVPIVGLIAGVWAVHRRAAPAGFSVLAAASAMAAWAALLLWTATQGPVITLATTLGHVAGVPAAALVVLTLCFAGLLAGSAALTGTAMIGRQGSTPVRRSR
jgi:hypothetical protein